MIQLLWIIGIIGMTAIWLMLAMMEFAIGEPTGKHSRFNPKAIPVGHLIGKGVHRKLKPVEPKKINITVPV